MMEVRGIGHQNTAFSSTFCCLQTSVTPCIEKDRVDIHPVFDRDQGSVRVEDFSGLPAGFVHLAWAALLRSYVANRAISFGLFSTAEDGASKKPIHDRSATSDPLDGDTQLSICQYHTVSERKCCDWAPDACSVLSENVRINTAIRSLRQGALKTNRLPYLHSDLPVSWIDVEVNLESENWIENIVLKTRSSKIPTPFARSIALTFQNILIEMARNREYRIGRLDQVSKEDKRTLMLWQPKELYTNFNCVQDLVDLTISSKPDFEAICAWDGSLTYAGLGAASSNVARQLVRAGVRVGDLIPWSFEKSLWAVVAALAILRAGAAFVPLDPSHPVARLEDILTTIKANLVVTSVGLQQKYLNLGKRAIVVSNQTAYKQPDEETDDVVDLPRVGPKDPAFVLFTSGSTGQPKGILHEHGPAVSHAIVNGEGMGYSGRVFQFSAFTFDMAVWDMFSTLILGGCICLPSDEDRLNNIPQAMNRMGVEFAFLTPSVASLLQPDEISTLKTLACGGECFRQEIIQRWMGRIHLINQYGIAEVGTIDLRHLDRDDSTSRTETVGYPLPTLFCILVDPDNHDRLVPIGAIGELLVTGTTIARGYINSEAKNLSSFISNLAWADEMGLRDRIFYKTGDLLQYNVGSFDGKYDFVKRKDGQLKFHGQRMEAGEVEHHLDGIPGVAVSAVVLPKQGCFSGQLVAAVQMSSSVSRPINRDSLWIDPSQALPIQTVKKCLSKSLPGYMIPTECLLIGNMPFTASCKVDRNTVRAWLETLASRPDDGSATAISIETSPLASEEGTAYSISVQVAEMIASRDISQGMQLQGHNFLLQSSGIDSIQTTSLNMFVQKTYGVKLPTSVFLSSSTTIRDVARMIDKKNAASDSTSEKIDLVKEVEVYTTELFRCIESFPPLAQDVSDPVTVRNVFLTGASGYLGSGILQNLLQKPEIEIYVLTRSPSIADALKQIKHRATRAGWWQENYASRVHIWQGDLAEIELGLKNEDLNCLRGECGDRPCIDTIIHNGAKVHYNLDYETLKASNLHPTKELLSFVSSTSNLSRFIYISGGRQPSAVEIPESMDAIQAILGNGYNQSKFVAEYLVRKCMDHPAFSSKSLRVIRPGYIIGSPPSGIANPTDFIWRLIAGCIEIGAYNEDEQNHWLFISDVERVSEIATSSLAKSQTSIRRGIYQILDGLYLSDLWNLLEEGFGYALKPLPQTHWLQSLETTILAKGESHLLFPLLHALETSAGRVGSNEAPSMEMESCSRVKEAVRANVRHLIDVGFLQQPPEHGVTELPKNGLVGAHESGEIAVPGSDASLTSSEERSSFGSASTANMSSLASSNSEGDESCGRRR